MIDASLYPETIKRWWSRYPLANLALASGLSKLIIVDIDPRHGGDEREFWQKVGGQVETVRTLTPGDGIHLWFIAPAGDFIVSVGKFLPGIDIRAGNGYVMLPPSSHLAGPCYVFESGHSPKDIDPAPCPPVLAEFARRKDEPDNESEDRTNSAGDQTHDAGDQRSGFDILKALNGVPEGQRNDCIFRAACWFRAFNTAKVVALKEVLDAAAKCNPPFPAATAKKILNRVYRQYLAGCAGTQTGNNEQSNASSDGSEPIIICASDSMALATTWAAHHVESTEGRTLHRWQNKFFRWTGTCYREEDDEAIRAELWPFFRYKARLVTAKGEPSLPKIRTINEAFDVLKAVCYLPNQLSVPAWVGDSEYPFDPAATVVPVQNGLLELGSRQIIAPTPKWFDVYVLGAHYDPEAQCPEWQRFLESIWPGDQQSRDCLSEIFGYLLTPDMTQQKGFMLIGPRRSGKGTIARVLEKLLGPEAIAKPALADFNTYFGIELLINKTIAIISDARDGGNALGGLPVERLLAISGQDSLSVPRKYLPAWNGALRTRFLILANQLPVFADAAGAITSRFILLTTLISFLGREDLTLYSRLTTPKELSGILNWALDGWMRLQERGHFVQPDGAQEAAQAFGDMANPLSTFVEDTCELGKDKITTFGDIYRRYIEWCQKNAARPTPMPVFSRDLRAAHPELQFMKPHGKPRRIIGIRPVSSLWETGNG